MLPLVCFYFNSFPILKLHEILHRKQAVLCVFLLSAAIPFFFFTPSFKGTRRIPCLGFTSPFWCVSGVPHYNKKKPVQFLPQNTESLRISVFFPLRIFRQGSGRVLKNPAVLLKQPDFLLVFTNHPLSELKEVSVKVKSCM